MRAKEPFPESWGRERKRTDEVSGFISLISSVSFAEGGSMSRHLPVGASRGVEPPGPPTTSSGEVTASSQQTATAVPQRQFPKHHETNAPLYIYNHKKRKKGDVRPGRRGRRSGRARCQPGRAPLHSHVSAGCSSRQLHFCFAHQERWGPAASTHGSGPAGSHRSSPLRQQR